MQQHIAPGREMLGLRITFATRFGEGSTFTLHLKDA